jgi:pyochelin synthetase
VTAHEPFALTDVQAAYWAGEQDVFELGGVAAHLYLEYEARDLDVARLQLALRRLVDRHDMLRAVVLPDGRQQVLPRVPPVAVPVVELSGRDPGEVDRELAGLRERMVAGGPASGAWPLFEMVVSRLDGRLARVHLNVSLLLCDAWSTGVLLRDLACLYADPDAALAPLAVTFRDCVLAGALAGEGSGRAREAALAYWLERASSLPPAPDLPLAADPAGLTQPRFRRRMARLGRDAWSRLRGRCHAARVTPSAALLTAYADALARRAGSPRMTINVLYAHRPAIHPDVRRVIGNFSSTLLVGVDAGAAPAFAARAERVQAALLQGLEHASVSGVRALGERNRVTGRVGHAAMPVVFASLLHLGSVENAARDAALGRRLETRVQTPQVWLDHQVYEEDGNLVLSWDAIDELFAPGLLDDLFGAYCGMLTRLAEDEWMIAPQAPTGPLFVAPGDALEASLAALWEQLLEVRPVGATDRFFDLGGTSLSALRLLARVREMTGRDMPLSALLTAPTVQDMAAWLRPTPPGKETTP